MSSNALDDDFNAPAPIKPARPTREDVLGALKWSEPKEVPTKRGPKIVTSAPAGEAVLTLWREEGDELYRLGYSVGEWQGKPQITKWSDVPQALVLARTEAKELSRATNAEVDLPRPEGLDYLGYQKAGISYALARPSVLFGDEPGLGKTIQAIGVINCDPTLRRILVICPASLKINWRRELEKWLVTERTIFIADSKLFPDLIGIVIVNYDVLRKHEATIRSIEWDLIIADEAHAMKNPEAQRTQVVFGVRASKKEKANGMADVPPLYARRRLLLTGTPICNRPKELFPLVSFLDPITWNNFFKFGVRYCNGNNATGYWDFNGSSNLAELQDKLRSSIMVRRLKKDVLKDLPPKTRKLVIFAPNAEARAAIEAEIDDEEGKEPDYEALAAVELAKASDDPEDYKRAVSALKAEKQTGGFASRSTFRKNVAIAKVRMPEVLDRLDEAVEESGKVILFVWHREVARLLMEHFGDSAVQIMGDDEMEDRQTSVDRFQREESVKVFVGSIKAAGVGLTLTASSRVIFLELDDVPGNISQAEDRAHRIGQRDNVFVEHYILEGSLDANMAQNIVSKQEVIDKALDRVKAELDAAVPVSSRPEKPTTFDALAKEAEAMTPDQRDAAVEAIKFLANRCNGARDWDGAGFSKIDTAIGRDLAGRMFLSRKQCALAKKIALRYAKTQLPEQLASRLGATESSKQ